MGGAGTPPTSKTNLHKANRSSTKQIRTQKRPENRPTASGANRSAKTAGNRPTASGARHAGQPGAEARAQHKNNQGGTKEHNGARPSTALRAKLALQQANLALIAGWGLPDSPSEILYPYPILGRSPAASRAGVHGRTRHGGHGTAPPYPRPHARCMRSLK